MLDMDFTSLLVDVIGAPKTAGARQRAAAERRSELSSRDTRTIRASVTARTH